MIRVVLFGAVWVMLLAVLLLALRSEPRQIAATERQPAGMRLPTPSPPPAPPRVGQRYPGWTVTRAYSAHHMMVIEVEADKVETARQIAIQVVEPLRDRYEEVLVYVKPPDWPAGELPPRRVQWTRTSGGYSEMKFER